MDKDFLDSIDNLKDLLPEGPETKLDDDVLICECFCVSVLDIRNLCEDIQRVDIERLQNHYDLGKGCQGCLKRIDSWQNKIF